MLQLLLIGVACLVGLYFLLHATYLKLRRCQSTARMDGKTVIITGANTGIGKTTATELARRGARVIMACRDRGRAQAAIHDIVQETGNSQVVFMHLDLASLKSVRAFAEEFLRSESRLDVLINNAGLVSDGKTEEGFGLIFGVNHLGHFLLTVLLLERLKASGPSRVVTVSSKGHLWGRVDFGCLSAHKDVRPSSSNGDFDLFLKYCDSKLCNILFTMELANRLQGTEVTCYSVHPGAIKTEIGRNFRFRSQLIQVPLVSLFFVDAVSGAQTTLHCSLQDGIQHLSGAYFDNCAPASWMVAKAKDAATAKKLWELSETFCGLS